MITQFNASDIVEIIGDIEFYYVVSVDYITETLTVQSKTQIAEREVKFAQIINRWGYVDGHLARH